MRSSTAKRKTNQPANLGGASGTQDEKNENTMKGTVKTQPHTYKIAAFVAGHSADCCSDCYKKESDPIHHLTPTKRLSWRTKADQFFQSFGCGQTHVIKFMGTCEGCGRSVYSHECAGAHPCGDQIEDSPDHRGMIPAEHCMNLYHAREYNLTGRDLLTCAACADDGNKYRAIIATAKSSGTWQPLSLYAEVKAAGGYIDDHESDLYIEDTPENRAILERYPTEKANATRFTNQVTGKRCIDIPFGFMPFWEKKAGTK
jgi:hypothetical protein